MDAIGQIMAVPVPHGVEEGYSRQPVSRANTTGLQDFGDLVSKNGNSGHGFQVNTGKSEEVISQYASIITTQFVGAIFEEQSGMFDAGDSASKHYHTMMVEAVSENLTETDALGLKSIIRWELSKW